MPIYTYRCNDCGHQFEQQQRMTDNSLTDCPVCNGRVRRIVNSVGVVFKGSGFYITDNRGGNAATLSANGKTGATTEDKPAEDKSTADKTTTEKTLTESSAVNKSTAAASDSPSSSATSKTTVSATPAVA